LFIPSTQTVPVTPYNTPSYPVPQGHKERFDQLKCDYSVNLLPVYYRDRFVLPDQVSDLLNGATCELHLSLTHNYIRKPEEAYDLLNGTIRQITMHAPGCGKPVSPYKRRDFKQGPLSPSQASSSKISKTFAEDE
jgi:hypothetical protein